MQKLTRAVFHKIITPARDDTVPAKRSPVGCPLAVPGGCPYPDDASVPAAVGSDAHARVGGMRQRTAARRTIRPSTIQSPVRRHPNSSFVRSV